MPSTATDSPFRSRLWARMALACLAVALVASVLVAVELLLFGVLSYGALWAGFGALRAVVPAPVGLVLAVVAYGVLVTVVAAAYRAGRDADEPVAPTLLGYASVALVGASLVVTYWAIARAGLPRWMFGMVVITLLASVYPMALYRTADEWSSDDESADEAPSWALDDDAAPWVSDESREADDDAERGTDGVSAVRDLRAVTRVVRRAVSALGDWLGPVGRSVTGLLLLGSLATVYAAATVYPPGDLVVPLAAAASALITVVHLGDTVRSELGDSAVLRELGSGVDAGADEGDRGALRRRVARLAAQADVPAPDVRLVGSHTPTAAAVGYRPSTSTLVVSTGLVDALSEAELEAVLAHELAHVANRDAAVLTALSFPRVTAREVFDRYGLNPVMALFAGVVAATSRLCTAVVARAREHAADDGAVAITGDPSALASALETLDSELSTRPSEDLRNTSAAAFSVVAPPWEEHRFFDRTRRFVSRGLLGTHPPTERRIERLRDRQRRIERS